MKPPELDFVLDRRARQRWRKLVFAALGLAFGLQLGIAGWRLQSMQAQRNALDAQFRQLQGKPVLARVDTPSPEQLRLALGAQAMVDSLSVPWEDLLGAIEAARTSRVVVEAIQPRAQDGSVRISVACPDFGCVAEFTQRLARQEQLLAVMLASEALPEGDAGSLRAVISANWRKAP